jgi:outer membrane protein TolC
VTTATARPNPVLNLNEAYNTTTSGISPWILTNAVDLMFDFSGRRKALRVQTTAQAEAARFRLTAAAWQVRSRIRTAMLGVYAARRSVDLLDDLAAAQADTVRTAEAMLRLGGISPYEVSQSRTALNATRDAAAQARVRGSDALATLARAIGVTPDALRAVSLDVSTFEALPETMLAPQARHAALLNRADMLAALADYDAAEGAIRVAVAGRAGGDTRLSPGYEFDQGSDKWGLAGGIPVPIFNQNQGPIAEAVAQRAQAQARVDAVQADAISQTDAALAAYRTTRDRVASDTQVASDLDRQLTVARARVTAGEASRFELAQRSLEIANAAIAREAAILAAQEARGRLEDALQQPTFPFPSPDAAPRTEANAR